MRLDNHSDELSPGRVFIHARLNDPMTGGPLYCRIRGIEGDLVEYEEIHTTNGATFGREDLGWLPGS